MFILPSWRGCQLPLHHLYVTEVVRMLKNEGYLYKPTSVPVAAGCRIGTSSEANSGLVGLSVCIVCVIALCCASTLHIAVILRQKLCGNSPVGLGTLFFLLCEFALSPSPYTNLFTTLHDPCRTDTFLPLYHDYMSLLTVITINTHGFLLLSFTTTILGLEDNI